MKMQSNSSFKEAMSVETAFTENGAISNASSGSALINFFFKTVRNTPIESLERMLADAWAESPLALLKLVFHLRDCRNGKAEKLQFYRALSWIAKINLTCVGTNLKHIPFFGTWKDLLELLSMLNGSNEFDKLAPIVWELFAKQLQDDYQKMMNGKTITLVGKWTPRENSKYDKKIKAFYHIKHKMGLTSKDMRKQVSALSKYSNVTEVQMCAQEWNGIKYSNVPSRCMYLHRKSFNKHDPNGFKKWLEDVAAGKKEINAKQLFPHELVKYYLDGNEPDAVIEAQWKSLVSSVKASYQDKNCLSICDVSGSMTGIPMCVAIALSILLAEITPEPFHGQIITFTLTPKFHVISGETLYDKVRNVKRMDWEVNTNFQKAIDMILTKCKTFNVQQKDMPSRLFVFSDMQFDNAINGQFGTPEDTKAMTNHAIMLQKYRDTGYNPPEIVFWNLRGDTIDFPATVADANVALVSGFSPSLMELFIDGEDICPMSIVNKILTCPRYQKIKLIN